MKKEDKELISLANFDLQCIILDEHQTDSKQKLADAIERIKDFMDKQNIADWTNFEDFEGLKYGRICSECGTEMVEGYCVNGGDAYYCSDKCLHKHITPEEWTELYDDGNGDSYWTAWEEENES